MIIPSYRTSSNKMTQLSLFLRLLQNTEALYELNTVFVHTNIQSSAPKGLEWQKIQK